MIYTAEHVRRDRVLQADLCVIGSGAGGAPVAWEAARHGLRVVVLEAGSYLEPRHFTQIEYDMVQRLYHDGAARTTADRAIHVLQGKGVGGSTLHNLNLCKRLPEEIAAQWFADHGLAPLQGGTLPALFAELEQLLGVSELGPAQANANNRVLERGCRALGWRGGWLRHNRRGCVGAGFCELGCPFDAKQNALKVFIAEAVEAGALVLADTWAERLEHDRRRVRAVEAAVRDPRTGAVRHRVRIEARAVCAAASATGTPALLLRSAVPDPYRLVGSRLFLHPGTAVAGIFAEPIHGWRGIPQSYECTEWLDLGPQSTRRVWIVPSFAHPAGAAATLGAFGAEHARLMRDYAHMAALSPMVHDLVPGRVRPRGRFGVAIEYRLDPSDAAQLRLGLVAAARLLFAAGARRVLVPASPALELAREDEIEPVLGALSLRPHTLDLTSVHPMSGCWMGDDPARACCEATGRYHHLDNLWVADTSLFPGSLGVPPQLTTYALGLHVGRCLLAALG
ncbi:MAG: oxidoreductase [Planctomycetota bacterium]|nr:MAG: oxidoreductase [Planctomycetota bacterium]